MDNSLFCTVIRKENREYSRLATIEFIASNMVNEVKAGHEVDVSLLYFLIGTLTSRVRLGLKPFIIDKSNFLNLSALAIELNFLNLSIIATIAGYYKDKLITGK